MRYSALTTHSLASVTRNERSIAVKAWISTQRCVLLCIWVLVASVDGCLAWTKEQPVSSTRLCVALVSDVLVRPILVIVESFVAAEILEAGSILQRGILYAAIHAEPVPMLHPVGLRRPLRRWLVAEAVVRRRQVASVGVRAYT